MKAIDHVMESEIRRLRQEFGSNRAFAVELGISESQVSKLLQGKTRFLSDETYSRLAPLLRLEEERCPRGYTVCPWAGDDHLANLMLNVISIRDPEWYKHLNEIIKREMQNWPESLPTQRKDGGNE